MSKHEEVEQLARTIVLVCQYTWPKDRERNVEKAKDLITSFLKEVILNERNNAAKIIEAYAREHGATSEHDDFGLAVDAITDDLIQAIRNGGK